MDDQFLLILLCLIISTLSSVSAYLSILRGGSSLSVENPNNFLVSPNGEFSAGFYPVGDNAYSFAVWFSKPSCSNNCTIVWMANRDFPVNGKGSKLLLLETGNLVLTDAGKSPAWSTGAESTSPVELGLSNIGNLVLQNGKDGVIWQSFDSPTDTLLPLQPLTRYTQLVSRRSYTNYSTGFYKLFFDNNNIIRLLYDGPKVSSVYWPDPWLQPWQAGRFQYNSSRIAWYDSLGTFISSDSFTFLPMDYGVQLQRRLTLDSDGNLRLYSREEEATTWVVSWQAKSQLFEIHGICGPNSTSSYDPMSGNKCSCLPGFKIKNTTDWTYGCEPEFSLSCGDNSNVSFIKLKNVDFYGNDAVFNNQNVSLEMCKQYCLESCNCQGFQYRYLDDNSEPYCYPKMLLINGEYASSSGGDFYLKVPRTFQFSEMKIESGPALNCSTEILQSLDRTYTRVGESGLLEALLWLACGLGGVEIIGIFFVWFFLINSQKHSNEATQSYHPAASGLKRFTYSELKKATCSFSEEIGRGAGGIVYKGMLSDNRVAAIKRLNIANQGEAEFLAEVSTIGKLNHMNLIELWGYCVEGKHRLLVYEFMEHGSLTENLSSKTLDWQKRFEIALGTARGLAYLHEECLEWVLHCDVKPQNILLDSNYQPKVSDFGLSKLLSRAGEGSNLLIFSKIRGTRGYMAPEWVFNLPITSKVDVYSYGIVVLEMVTGRSPIVGGQDVQSDGDIEHRGLVTSVREKKNKADGKALWIEDIVDSTLEGKYDKDKMETLITLALDCVEEDKDARPTMSRVVETLTSQFS